MKNVKHLFILSLLWLSAVVQAETLSPTILIDNWLTDTDIQYPYQGEAVQWKFAHPAPPVSLLPPVWQKGFDWLNAATDQGIRIKQYGGGTLYGVKGGVKAIRAGIADAGTCYSFFESKGFELTQAFSVSSVAPNNTYLTAKIITELAPKYLSPEFEKRGVHLGHIFPMTPLTLMSKTPVRKPEDLQGKKIASFMRLSNAARVMGYEEVFMPFPEVYTALQQGVIDAVIWSDMGFVPFKIYEQAKYYTDINIATATIETCINKQSFNKLAAPLKQAVYDTQQKLMLGLVDKNVAFSKQALDIYKEKGVELIQLSPAERLTWASSFAEVKQDWLEKCEASGKECKSLLKDINRLRLKYEGMSDSALVKSMIDKPIQGIIKF
ncbi:MAG: TRAP-type C4-dicarboxylate transport system substrate-binding protein [Oleiphilaceae bacterium]|jgi:TRAP-type C4-dicarboxylate transport system substrate-binding protein